LDVSQDQTSMCVVDENGRVLWQGKCATIPEAIAGTLRTRASQAERIGLESGPLSIWLCHALTALGLPVVCLDARHAQAALSLQLNKSDANDARGLAQIVRTGWYREVAVKSLDGQRVRGVLKPFGLVAGKGVGKTFAAKVRSLVADGPLQDVAEALLRAWEAIDKEVAALSRRLLAEARQDDTVRRLMTAPGVGVLVALTYVSVIGDPARFPISA
jgi:transposase